MFIIRSLLIFFYDLFSAFILGEELRSAGSSGRSEPSGTRDIVKKVGDS